MLGKGSDRVQQITVFQFTTKLGNQQNDDEKELGQDIYGWEPNPVQVGAPQEQSTITFPHIMLPNSSVAK